MSTISCNSSPAYLSSLSGFNPKSRRQVFRRVKSDSSLEGLFSNSLDLEDLYFSRILIRGSADKHNPMLHTEPSFCIYSTDDGVEEVLGNEDLEGQKVVEGDGIAALGSPKFSFGNHAMALIEEDGGEEEGKEEALSEIKDLGIEDEAVSSPWPLAGAIGSDGDGGGLDSGSSRFDENDDVEENYKRVIREDPSNPLFLRNYAQFLQVSSN